MGCQHGFHNKSQRSCPNINKRSADGAKKFCKMASILHDPLESDDLEAIRSILGDETNKTQLGDDFIFQRGIQGETRGELPLPIFCNQLLLLLGFFCNHLEELQTVLYEVEWITNNAPFNISLHKQYQNMFNTQSYFSGRLLLNSLNTTSTLVTNITILSSTTDKINRISNHFWYK